MTKQDLADRVWEKLPFRLTKHQTSLTINLCFDEIIKSITEGDSVKLTNFGTLSPLVRRPSRRKPPGKSEIINIPGRTAIRFTPAAGVMKRINIQIP